MNIPDTDPEAFGIVLNLMHCRTTMVPREVELPLLTGIAVVVDYLDCREALGLYPESWVNKSRNSVPGIFCADATNWGFISYVFGDANIFSSTTQLAQQQGLDMFDSTNLGAIIKAIKSRGLLSRAENAPFPGYLTAI